MNLIPKNLSQLRRIALSVLLASFAILDTTSISAQELRKTITSPFGVANPYMNTSDASESGSEGDTFVDPETGEVGHIIRNPFGVANPEGVDTGIDIPDDAGEEVGGIITSPFGVPASDDIDTGVDVFDEDEEYLISLPDDEESEAEDSEDVDGVDDETSDDVKELEGESYETTTEKVLPVIDNPTRGVEFTIELSLTGSTGDDYSVTSTEHNISYAPTLYVATGGNFTLTVASTDNQTLVKENISFYFDGTLDTLSEVFENKQYLNGSSTLTSHTFSYHVNPSAYGGLHNVAVIYHYNNDVTIVRCLKIEVVYFELKIDYSGNGAIDDDDVYDANNPFGKLIHINNLDVDQDGIPDYADGFQSYGVDGENNRTLLSGASCGNNSLPFEKIKIRVSKGLDLTQWRLSFDYNKSNLDVNVYGRPYAPEYRTFEPGDNGTIRLWAKDGNEARSRNTITNVNQGDFIPNNTNIPLAKFANNRIEKNDYDEYTLYVEAVKPLNKTANTGDIIKASLKKGNIPTFHFDKQIYVTPYQVVFEAITTWRYTQDNGQYAAYFNPCSLVKNKNGRFAFTTIPAGIPDSKFTWTASANLSFINGSNVGKNVYVHADNYVDDYWLEINIGRGEDNPKIKGEILEEHTVDLYIWIVADNTSGVNPEFQEADVHSLVSIANDVYKQVGIIFRIENIDYIARRNYKYSRPGQPTTIDDLKLITTEVQAKVLTCYPQDIGYQRGPGLEIFFTDQMYTLGLSVRAFWRPKEDGIIVARRDMNGAVSSPKVLAHELGHACDLDDIYVQDRGSTPPVPIDTTINVNSLWIKDEDYTYAGNTNNVMSATGYYRYNLKHINIINGLLMNGIDAPNPINIDLPANIDFPGNKVYGYNSSNTKGMIKVGLSDMNRTPTHSNAIE